MIKGPTSLRPQTPERSTFRNSAGNEGGMGGSAVQDDLRALRAVVEGTARGTGQEFFRSLVRHLAEDSDGNILGHLAVFDERPMPAEPRRDFIFRIFAARATAERERMRTEQRLRD